MARAFTCGLAQPIFPCVRTNGSCFWRKTSIRCWRANGSACVISPPSLCSAMPACSLWESDIWPSARRSSGCRHSAEASSHGWFAQSSKLDLYQYQKWEISRFSAHSALQEMLCGDETECSASPFCGPHVHHSKAVHQGTQVLLPDVFEHFRCQAVSYFGVVFTDEARSPEKSWTGEETQRNGEYGICRMIPTLLKN